MFSFRPGYNRNMLGMARGAATFGPYHGDILFMPIIKRAKTKYLTIYCVVGVSSLEGNKDGRIYYIRYRKNGKKIEENADRRLRAQMIPASEAEIHA